MQRLRSHFGPSTSWTASVEARQGRRPDVFVRAKKDNAPPPRRFHPRTPCLVTQSSQVKNDWLNPLSTCQGPSLRRALR